MEDLTGMHMKVVDRYCHSPQLSDSKSHYQDSKNHRQPKDDASFVLTFDTCNRLFWDVKLRLVCMELINCNSSFNQSYMKTRDLAHQAQNQHYSAQAEFVDGVHSGDINLS